MQELKNRNGVDIVASLGESWIIYKKDWLAFSITALVFLLVHLLAQFIPYVGGLLVAGPMTVGFYLVIADSTRGKRFSAGRIFQGFSFFIPAFFASILIMAFSTMGLFLLIIPGLIISGWYLMTYIFIIDKSLDFWEAMESSRKVAFEDMVSMTIFYLALIAINLLGVLFFLVGLLVTIPLTHIAIFVAYRNLVGFTSLDTQPTLDGRSTAGDSRDADEI